MFFWGGKCLSSYILTNIFHHNSSEKKKKSNKYACFPYISRLASAAHITMKYLDVTAQVS